MVVLVSCPSAAFAVRHQSCSSILVSEVVVGDVVVEQKPRRRYKQLLRKLVAGNLHRSQLKNRHSWTCCKSSFARKLLFEYERLNTGMRRWTTAKNTLVLGAF